MPNCDFYALAPDLVGVLDFVFAQPGWTLFELASVPDRPLREFRATKAVLDAYPTFGRLAASLNFQLYGSTMGGGVTQRRIEFEPGALPGKTFRYEAAGWGLIQLYFGGLRARRLSPCHTNHNSQRRAEKWEPTSPDRLGQVAAWNWPEVVRMSSRLNRFIRSAAAGKVNSRPMLPQAHAAHTRGDVDLAPF